MLFVRFLITVFWFALFVEKVVNELNILHPIMNRLPLVPLRLLKLSGIRDCGNSFGFEQSLIDRMELRETSPDLGRYGAGRVFERRLFDELGL